MILCIEEFKVEIEKLRRKNSYKDLEEVVIEHFFNKPLSKLLSGNRLNNSESAPYIKKRLDGRGGYRIYFLALILQNNIYLMFVHPKTGSQGYEKIHDDYKSKLYKIVLHAIQENNLYEVKSNDKKDGLIFEKVKKK